MTKISDIIIKLLIAFLMMYLIFVYGLQNKKSNNEIKLNNDTLNIDTLCN